LNVSSQWAKGYVVDVETDNLLLRQWCVDDFDFYSGYLANEETAQYIGGVVSRDKAWRHLASVIGHWALKGFGPWAVEEKATGELVGCAGLWEPYGWPEVELPYWFVGSAYTNGYASEAARKVREYAHEVLGVSRLVTYIPPENEASRRVVESMGAKLDGTIDLCDFGVHCVYRHADAGNDLNE